MGADTLLQGPHLQGQSSATRAMASGSLHIHRCTGNTGYPQPLKWAKPGVILRGCVCSVRGEASREHSGKQSAPPNTHTFSPTWKFSLSLPFSLLPVLTLAALLQVAGSDLLEALSTSHLVLISVRNQF